MFHTIILSDLISRRLVLVKVMFSIEPTCLLDVTIQRNRGAQSGEKRCDLEFLHQPARQHPDKSRQFRSKTNRLAPWKCQIKQCHIGIGHFAQCRRRTYTESTSAYLSLEKSTHEKTTWSPYPTAHGSRSPRSTPISAATPSLALRFPSCGPWRLWRLALVVCGGVCDLGVRWPWPWS